MDLHSQHLRPAPGEDLDLGDDARSDAVAKAAGEPLLDINWVGYAADVPAPVFHTDEQGPARGVGEGHDCLQRPVGRGEVALELQRLALRELEELHEVHNARKQTRKEALASSFRVAGPMCPSGRLTICRSAA